MHDFLWVASKENVGVANTKEVLKCPNLKPPLHRGVDIFMSEVQGSGTNLPEAKCFQRDRTTQ